MATKKWAMALVLFSTVLAASGQILIKSGLNAMGEGFMERIFDLWYSVPTAAPMIIGYGLYGIAAVILIVSLKHGELSVLYPIYAMNFVWVAIMSPHFFPGADIMTPLKWIGVGAIVVGVALIGMGSKEAEDG